MPVKWGFSRHGRTEASTAGRPRLSVRGQLPTSIVTRSCKCIPVALVCSVFLGASVRCPYHGMRAPKIEKHPEWPPNGAKPALATKWSFEQIGGKGALASPFDERGLEEDVGRTKGLPRAAAHARP